jgi:PAS domain S-box-containing protein
MMSHTSPNSIVTIAFLVILITPVFFPDYSYCTQSEVKIGVLANWGSEGAIKKWTKTAEYLTREIPEHIFTIDPLGFKEILPAVQKGTVDFVIVNPEFYVDLESKFGTSRIATLKNKLRDSSYKVFGGVIFCRADHLNVLNLHNLKGKKFMAVEETSLGGWTMALREFKASGIDPYKDFSGVSFGGRQDTVVFAVRDHTVDAGTVRTDTLERLADEGKIHLKDYRILNRQNVENFPIALSTRLYPEWPFAKLKNTSDELARDVAIALLKMPPDDPAALSASSEGWTIPLDYQPVHELMKELRIGAYKDFGETTLSSVLRQYRYWLVSTFLLLLLMALTISFVIRLNRVLRQSRIDLEKSRDELEQKVTERTAELEIEIGERAQAVQALSESERRFREVLENIHMVAVTLDTKGNITFCNDFLLSLTGWSREEILGSNWFDIFISTDDDFNIKKIFAEAMASASLPAHYEIPIKTRTGAERLIVWDNTLLKDVGGTVVGAASIGMDVTDHRSTEAQLFQSQKMEAIGNLAGGVAHDFNNLLTPILGYAEMIRLKFPEEDPVHRRASTILDAAGKAKDLVRHLLSFSRKQVLDSQVHDLNEIITAFTDIMQRTIRESVAISNKLCTSPCPIKSDRTQIEQILLNLAVNAQDAISSNGTITIETGHVLIDDEYCQLHPGARPGPYVMMTVTDNGSGMDNETLSHIFEPFFSTKLVGKGTGLGLSTVYGIVKQHDGYIDVLSKPGKGTTFRMYLPLSGIVEKQENASSQHIAATPVLTGPATILVVEDNEMVLEMARELLENNGYTVLSAYLPEDAINIARQHKGGLNLLLTDVIMPQMNGPDLYERLKEFTSDLPVLYMSGYTGNVNVHDGTLEEEARCIAKPFTAETLLSEVARVLASDNCA